MLKMIIIVHPLLRERMKDQDRMRDREERRRQEQDRKRRENERNYKR